jgi:hypothetical protein
MSTQSQWKVYAELEQIPGLIAESQMTESKLIQPLQAVGQTLSRGFSASLLNLFCRELYYEQQIEYLERCLECSQFQSQQGEKANSWRGFQKLFLAVLRG